jgi:hypothetical protein
MDMASPLLTSPLRGEVGASAPGEGGDDGTVCHAAELHPSPQLCHVAALLASLPSPQRGEGALGSPLGVLQ